MRSVLPFVASAVLSCLAPVAAAAQPAVAPKVLVITMFSEEAKPWLAHEDLSQKVAVPGLPADYPEVACNSAGSAT